MIATGLASPWSMVRLASGSTLISERDTALVNELTADGSRARGRGRAGCRAGRRGRAARARVRRRATRPLRILHGGLRQPHRAASRSTGAAGAYALGAGEEILTGIAEGGQPQRRAHRVRPGRHALRDRRRRRRPRAMRRTRARSTARSCACSPTARCPTTTRSPVRSSTRSGTATRRASRGIATAGSGPREFGQNTWDEFNLIEPAANYGWPVVEGAAPDPAFVEPRLPVADERGEPERPGLHPRTPSSSPPCAGSACGRSTPSPRAPRRWAGSSASTAGIRDVIPGPDGSVWMLTNNTDGRGEPRDGDDRILQVELAPLADPPAEPGQG